MKKSLFYLIVCLISFCLVTDVDAKCIVDENAYIGFTNHFPDEIYTEIRISGITEEIYAVVKNNYNNEDETYTFADINEDGMVVFRSPNIYKKIIYKVEFFSNLEECGIEPLMEQEIETSKYNVYSSYDVCDQQENIEMCDPFWDNSNLNSEDFIEEVEDIKIELNKSFKDKLWDFIKAYYLFVLIPIIVIALYYTLRVVVIKRRKNNE